MCIFSSLTFFVEMWEFWNKIWYAVHFFTIWNLIWCPEKSNKTSNQSKLKTFIKKKIDREIFHRWITKDILKLYKKIFLTHTFSELFHHRHLDLHKKLIYNHWHKLMRRPPPYSSNWFCKSSNINFEDWNWGRG